MILATETVDETIHDEYSDNFQMEPEVEVIQFRPPGPATTLRLPIVLAPPDMEETQVWYFLWIVSWY